MFTDIVSSTERAAELGDSRWRDLIERTTRSCGASWSATAAARSRRSATASSPPSTARRAASAAPRRSATRCAPSGVEIRAGLHTGELEVVGDDVAGMAVNIGARVGAKAGPGEVLVSSTVTDLVVGSGLEFLERGTHELKGVPGEWKLFAVAD